MIGGLGMMQSFMHADHSVPAGMRVVELKSCENCTVVFTRTRPLAFRRVVLEDSDKELFVDTGARYCKACRANALLPVDDAAYREMLPKEVEMRHANYLPHYDLTTVALNPVPPRRPRRNYGNWLFRLLEAHQQGGPLTYRRMLELTGMPTSGTLSASLAHMGFKTILAGNVWPRVPKCAVNPKLYNLTVRVN